MEMKMFLAPILLFMLPSLGVNSLSSSDNGTVANTTVLDYSTIFDNSTAIDNTTDVLQGNYTEKHDNETIGNHTIDKLCGPDITSWLISQLNKNEKHVEIKRCSSRYKIVWWPICLKKFADLVGNGKPWDFKRTQKFIYGGCPSQCSHTVTLCGKCVNYDVPGNIHYGYVGRAATIRRWLLLFAADQVQKGGVDDPRDQKAIEIGMDLWDFEEKREDICKEVAPKIYSLNRDGTFHCYRCTEKYPKEGVPKK